MKSIAVITVKFCLARDFPLADTSGFKWPGEAKGKRALFT